MFNAKQNIRNYMSIMRPWAAGVQERGWRYDDFFDIGPADPLTGEMKYEPKEGVMKMRTVPDHIIFAIRPYDITLFDRLFLPLNILRAIMDLNQAITSFNTVLDTVNNAPSVDVKWDRTILLHVGCVGQIGGFGIHDRFEKLAGLLEPRG